MSMRWFVNWYPDAKRIASNLKNITCATFHPDDVEASAELDGTDLAVVDGRIGVCENGAVWGAAGCGTACGVLYF